MSQASSSAAAATPQTSLKRSGWQLAACTGPSLTDRLPFDGVERFELRPSSHHPLGNVRVVPGQALLLHLRNPSVAEGTYRLEVVAGLTGRDRTLLLEFEVRSRPLDSPPQSSDGKGSQAVDLWLDGSGDLAKVALVWTSVAEFADKRWQWVSLALADAETDTVVKGALVVRLYRVVSQPPPKPTSASDVLALYHQARSNGVAQRSMKVDLGLASREDRPPPSSHSLKVVLPEPSQKSIGTFIIAYDLSPVLAPFTTASVSSQSLSTEPCPPCEGTAGLLKRPSEDPVDGRPSKMAKVTSPQRSSPPRSAAHDDSPDDAPGPSLSVDVALPTIQKHTSRPLVIAAVDAANDTLDEVAESEQTDSDAGDGGASKLVDESDEDRGSPEEVESDVSETEGDEADNGSRNAAGEGSPLANERNEADEANSDVEVLDVRSTSDDADDGVQTTDVKVEEQEAAAADLRSRSTTVGSVGIGLAEVVVESELAENEKDLRAGIRPRVAKAVAREAEIQARPYRLIKHDGSQEDHDAILDAIVSTIRKRCEAKVIDVALTFLAKLTPDYSWPDPDDLAASHPTHIFDLLDHLDDVITDAVEMEQLMKVSALRTAWEPHWGDSPQDMVESRRGVTYTCTRDKVARALKYIKESAT